MKFLFTITLNCVLLVLVSEAYPNHESCAKEALERLIKIEDKLITQLCELGEKIKLVSCEKLYNKFYNDIQKLKHDIPEVIESYLEHATIVGGSFIASKEEIVLSIDKNEEIGKEINQLENNINTAIKVQHHSHHDKPKGCGCKKSH